MEAQGYTIENNILYQDNKSTILLAKNGRMSAGKNSKHIKKRCFLITDKVAQGNLEIHHKGTDDMWVDVNTKLTQGKRFRVMHRKVMGIRADYDDDVERRRTHPILMPKVESERISAADGEILKYFAIVAPAKSPAKNSTRGVLQGARVKSILPGVKPTAKRRSVLSEDKYAPGETSRWKHVSTRFPTLSKALLDEPDQTVCRSMYHTTVRRAG